jgi:hypothetical protein
MIRGVNLKHERIDWATSLVAPLNDTASGTPLLSRAPCHAPSSQASQAHAYLAELDGLLRCSSVQG